jgi:hypothetical protein
VNLETNSEKETPFSISTGKRVSDKVWEYAIVGINASFDLML